MNDSVKVFWLLLVQHFFATSAFADRFGRYEPGNESNAPIEVVIYMILALILFVHEKSPLSEWAKDHPVLSFGGCLIGLPVCYMAKPSLTIGLVVLALVMFTLIVFLRSK